MNTIFIMTGNEFLRDKYSEVKNHGDDSGFDLYCPLDLEIPARSTSFRIDLEIKTEFRDTNDGNVGYQVLPRSSTGSKTPLRLCNSIGIIDRSYRGSVMAFVDNNSDSIYNVNKGDRLFQAVSFNGEPITCKLVTELNNTSRGSGGFGSTGK